jgi:hypothetical protein
MNNQFEQMQKLAFGKVLIKESTENKKYTQKELKAQIREMILDEAKKKKNKPEDVAPQEDVDIDLNMGDEQLPAEPTGEEPPMDVTAPDTTAGDIDPTVKSIQDSLQKAFAQAKQLGDEKLMNQIGNTITMLVRTQVLGQQNVNENLTEEDTKKLIGIFSDMVDAIRLPFELGIKFEITDEEFNTLMAAIEVANKLWYKHGGRNNESLNEMIGDLGKYDYLSNALSHVWNMGKGNNSVDFDNLSKSIIDDLESRF